MADLADAFVALPGAAGTLEELFEAWTWGMLGLHAKPTALLDVDGFWQPLLTQLRRMVDDGYLDGRRLDALGVVHSAAGLLAFVEDYRHPRAQVDGSSADPPRPDRVGLPAGNPIGTTASCVALGAMTPPLARESRVVHGHRRAFVRAGSGPALLLLHGIGNNCQTWAGVIDRLAETHTVIAPDLLGHGDVRQAARRLLDRRPTPTACATCCRCSTSSGRPSSATPSAAASRCSSPTSSPSAASGSCWSAAAGSARSCRPGCARPRCPARNWCSRALTGVSGPLRLGFQALDRVGQARRAAAGARPGRGRRRAARAQGRRGAARVPAHAARGGRRPRPGGHRARPALPGQRRPDAGHLGQPRPDRARRCTPRRCARWCRPRGSRCSGAPGTGRTSTTPTASATCCWTSCATTEPAAARPRQLAAAAARRTSGAAPRGAVAPSVRGVEHWDVVVVGGGPAGAACAAAARRAAPAARVLRARPRRLPPRQGLRRRHRARGARRPRRARASTPAR